MLFLILEIGLTVAAWRKGWRAWALLPVGTLVVVAFLIGTAVGASGGSLEPVTPVVLLLDLACIGVLIGMAMRAQLPATCEIKVPTEVTAGSAKL